jgi:signal transduction histidine kinase
MNRIDLHARYERLRLLYQVSKVIHSTLEPNQVLRLIVNEAVRVMRASSGSIALINPTTQLLEIQAARGIPAPAAELRLRMGEGITGWVARTGRPARVGDVRSDSRYVPIRPDVRSELAVPLEVNGEIRGILNVDSERVEAFTAADQELLAELADQAAKVIHNTWLYEQLRLKARLFESLISVGHTINSALDLEDALRVITREASLLMEAKMCSLLLLDETGQSLRLSASHGAGDAYLHKPHINVEESLVGVVIRRKRALQELDVRSSTRYLHTDLARKEGLVSLLSVPLVFRGQAIGAINVYTGEPHLFSNEEIRILTALADLSAVAIEKARLYRRVVDVEERMRRNEKLSALGLLAAEVAHEIRNPLTVMKMLYHSLDLRFPEGDPRSRDAEIMGGKIEHLNQIVEQILVFARGAEPSLEVVDVNPLLQELALLTRHKLTQQGVRVQHRLAANLPAIMADAGQLHQVFLNLILNAAEAMPDGGQLVVRSRLEAPSPKSTLPAVVRIDFKDTGQGMSKEQQQQAFTAMLSSTKPKGTGLGLAIVGRIVEAHHGSIQIRSRLHHGTTITIRFPVPASPTGVRG